MASWLLERERRKTYLTIKSINYHALLGIYVHRNIFRPSKTSSYSGLCWWKESHFFPTKHTCLPEACGHWLIFSKLLLFHPWKCKNSMASYVYYSSICVDIQLYNLLQVAYQFYLAQIFFITTKSYQGCCARIRVNPIPLHHQHPHPSELHTSGDWNEEVDSIKKKCWAFSGTCDMNLEQDLAISPGVNVTPEGGNEVGFPDCRKLWREGYGVVIGEWVLEGDDSIVVNLLIIL